MVFGTFAVLAPSGTAESSPSPKIVQPERVDLGPEFRQSSLNMHAVQSDAMAKDGVMESNAFNAYYNVSDTEYFYTGSYGQGFMKFEMRGEGNHCEIWVANDLSFPEGDDRNNETLSLTINDTQVNYMIDQFDNVIYPTESEYFAEPDNLTGDNSWFESWGYPFFQTDDPGKVMIMVFNIVDENYYDP